MNHMLWQFWLPYPNKSGSKYGTSFKLLSLQSLLNTLVKYTCKEILEAEIVKVI